MMCSTIRVFVLVVVVRDVHVVKVATIPRCSCQLAHREQQKEVLGFFLPRPLSSIQRRDSSNTSRKVYD